MLWITMHICKIASRSLPSCVNANFCQQIFCTSPSRLPPFSPASTRYGRGQRQSIGKRNQYELFWSLPFKKSPKEIISFTKNRMTKRTHFRKRNQKKTKSTVYGRVVPKECDLSFYHYQKEAQNDLPGCFDTGFQSLSSHQRLLFCVIL